MVSALQPISTCPEKVEVILQASNGKFMVGQNFGSVKYPMFKSELDFIDGYCQFFWPKDDLPVHWLPLPTPIYDEEGAA